MINILNNKSVAVTPHHLATKAATEVLKEGANAIEAAIVGATVISVVYPHMNSLGGDNFWLIYDAKNKSLNGLNASGKSGERATIQYYKNLGYSKIPFRGYLACNTVPGAVSGLQKAYEYSKTKLNGTKSFSYLFEKAISYAQNGFPVTKSQEEYTNENITSLKIFKGFKETFLNQEGLPYKEKELFKQPILAKTLELIAQKGATEFYSGKIANKIVSEIQANGGILTLDDFENHTANWINPIKGFYRDFTVYNLPPNTQGFASILILQILNNFDFTKIEEGSTDYYHLLIEACKQAFIIRDKYLTDPDFYDIPLDYILSKEHANLLAKNISLEKTADFNYQLEPKGDTVWLGFSDEMGNAVSLIQSTYHEFGSGIIPEDTGITLQNRGCFFSLDENHPNKLEPQKRTFHTLNPAMLFKNNKPYLIYGTMGGEGQPQTQATIVTRIVDYNYDVQNAINAPRYLYGRAWGETENDVKFESRVPVSILEELKKRGHLIKTVEKFSNLMGHAGAIQIDPKTDTKQVAADIRSDGNPINKETSL
ncbi:gamma-glutamyltransferase [Selenomonadales bacterium OttesenSCG-928-I06]|nr:gamma-glutamyltransferase [Selenomonadales bacterium OttesenSCG-928-I06]